MTKRFKKLLSALCIISLLVSSIATVFANGDPEAELPAVHEPAAEANATDNTEAAAAPTAAEEAPAQDAAPATVEEAPSQETAPATVEEAPAQEAVPATVEEAPVQETAPATVEEAPAQETAPATVEEAPAQETAPATVEEAPAQETAPATVEEAPAQEAAPATVEEAPAQETAPATVEEAPAQETAPATVEEAPAQETAPATVEEAPAQETVPVTTEEAPAQETAPVITEEAPAEETTPVTTEEAPAQETAPVTTEETPAQEPTPVTTEEAPAQETAPVTTEETPAQETAPVITEEAPAQETTPVTTEEAPAQETTPVTTEEAPAQETAPVTVEEAPAQETTPVTTEEAPAQETSPETVEETPAQNDGSAAETAPAQEDAADLNAAPVQEDTAPAEETDANSDESVVTEENIPADGIDELANEPANYSEDELVELEDNGGYIDPEFIAENFPEITPEMKYENINEMKVGSMISGSAGVDEILYYIKAARTQNIILVLQTNGNIQVRINERAVSFIDNEDGTKSYEMKVQYDQTYIIGISGQGAFQLSTEVKVVEEPEEIEEEIDEETETVDEQNEAPVVEGETAEEITETTETNGNTENNESLNNEPAQTTDEVPATDAEVPAEPSENGTTETEQTEVKNTENTQAAIAETVENNAEEATEVIENTEPAEEKPVETSKPKINTWVTANNNEEEGTVTVYANADIELDNQIVWQTRSADSEEWKKAGYGLKLTVEVTEENANNFFRFKLADGEFSPEYQIHATVKAAEEEIEEAIEGIPAENEAEEETIVSEEIEEETASNVSTEEEAEEAVAEETAETETIASEEVVETVEETEETAAETEVIEEATETEVTEEKAEAEEQTAEEAESEEETEEAEEEVTEEETEEEEAKPLTEEQLIELGYRKIQIINQNGTNLYDNTTGEATVIGTAETGAELWIKDTEVEGWAEIYTEDEVQKFLKPAETEKQPLTEKQLIEHGYRKIQIMNQNGTSIYGGTDNYDVIDFIEPGTEIWIRDIEDEGWAELYTEGENTKLVKLDETVKQMPSDEEMLDEGYIKTFVAIDIGANTYGSQTAEEADGHLDVGTELWVMLYENADRALIYNLDENAPPEYVNLVDIIATMKPETMIDLPTREIIIHSSLEGLESVHSGTVVTYEAELINFMEDDQFTIQWKYSEDGIEFIDIDGANELVYEYSINKTNVDYTWRISIVLITPKVAEE